MLHLTPGQDADIAAAPYVLALAPPMSALLTDKGYDGDNLRGEIVRRGAKPVIPNKSNRVVIHRFNKRAHKGRNVIERCFCSLKDFRRIATRYDKLATSSLSSVPTTTTLRRKSFARACARSSIVSASCRKSADTCVAVSALPRFPQPSATLVQSYGFGALNAALAIARI